MGHEEGNPDAGEIARLAVAFVRPRLRGVLHELAFPLSLLAGAWAVLHAAAGVARVSTAVYACTLSACLGVSALYHRGRWSERARQWLRRLDHATIFLLIAGTFTPIATLALSGWLGVTTLIVVWGGALVGGLLAVLWIDAPAVLEVGPYLAIGLYGVVLVPRLLSGIGVAAVILLGLGGAAYVAGAIVYASHRPDPWPRTFGFHEIFHALVLAAASMQWVAITHWVLAA